MTCGPSEAFEKKMLVFIFALHVYELNSNHKGCVQHPGRIRYLPLRATNVHDRSFDLGFFILDSVLTTGFPPGI